MEIIYCPNDFLRDKQFYEDLNYDEVTEILNELLKIPQDYINIIHSILHDSQKNLTPIASLFGDILDLYRSAYEDKSDYWKLSLLKR